MDEHLDHLIKRIKRDIRYYEAELENTTKAYENIIKDKKAWLAIVESLKT